MTKMGPKWNHRAKYKLSGSNMILFDRYCQDTDTHTHTHTQPTNCSAQPLKWTVTRHRPDCGETIGLRWWELECATGKLRATVQMLQVRSPHSGYLSWLSLHAAEPLSTVQPPDECNWSGNGFVTVLADSYTTKLASPVGSTSATWIYYQPISFL